MIFVVNKHLVILSVSFAGGHYVSVLIFCFLLHVRIQIQAGNGSHGETGMSFDKVTSGLIIV